MAKNGISLVICRMYVDPFILLLLHTCKLHDIFSVLLFSFVLMLV